MKTTSNTILIIGGSAGIGFETAKKFSSEGNQVIITGRDKTRLDNALSLLPGVKGIVSDISSKEDTYKLVELILRDYPELNIVVNNAGKAYLYDLASSENAFDKAEDEMLTNYLAIIRLNEALIPLLKAQVEAAIVNVSSIVAIVPGGLPSYSASKAALHSYTQALRISLAKTSDIRVFELMPPLVNTELSAPIGGANGIPPAQVAQELFDGIANNIFEIRIGNTQHIYDLYLKSPDEALAAMNAN